MTDRIPTACVMSGEGWAVWEAEIPQETPHVSISEKAVITDAQTFETVTLYRPVDVDMTGEVARAFYRTSDYDHDEDEGWRVYVDARFIRTSRPKRAHPAYRFGVDGPQERIEYEELPKEYKDND